MFNTLVTILKAAKAYTCVCVCVLCVFLLVQFYASSFTSSSFFLLFQNIYLQFSCFFFQFIHPFHFILRPFPFYFSQSHFNDVFFFGFFCQRKTLMYSASLAIYSYCRFSFSSYMYKYIFVRVVLSLFSCFSNAFCYAALPHFIFRQK